MCQIWNEMSFPYNGICSPDLCCFIWPYNIFSELSCLYEVIPTKCLVESYRHVKQRIIWKFIQCYINRIFKIKAQNYMEIYPMLYQPDFQNKSIELYGNLSYVISTGFSN